MSLLRQPDSAGIYSHLYFLAGQLRYGIAWAPEIWTGTLVLTILMGVGLSLIAAPPAAPDARPK